MEQRKKILIVEDEAIIAEDLRDILEHLGYEVVGVAARASVALELLRQGPPDLVFLDVMLQGELDGVDLAHRLRSECSVPFVFLTSLSNAATVARIKEARPHGYLVKPFAERDIYVALEMAFANYAAEQGVATATSVVVGPERTALYVRDKGRHIKVEFNDVLWLEANGNYTTLHTRTNKIVVCMQLKQVEEKLPEADFIRIHRSYMVALRNIAAIETQNVIVAHHSASLPIGRAYRDALFHRLNLLD
ncbi:LytR/AlgR family response regulator transcription factor [Hymenobacter weizhouensis]|uniref:LytR/AlgR family response regulator transcription factor n=1 Tax=Hymenobacter sp. YIM 151500-1 TaxID=2987689 RepID=UPI002227F1A4|nr:response regulator [Hymenobacter sp. YIM 151500-1]UYZ63882.1 response regulator [Hymenobacter sp. YIM 151500-1]